jgi:uncharacterized protein YfaP (DUF2135 family)
MLSVISFSMVEYLDVVLSDFPSVSILASLKGYYPVNECNFKENCRTLPCNITVLKEVEAQSIDFHFFVDTSLSMNNRIQSVQKAFEEIFALASNTSTKKALHFYTLENHVHSISENEPLESDFVVRALFSSVDSPDEQPLGYLSNIIDKTDSPSVFFVFTDQDGFANIELERIKEISKKLITSGCYLIVVCSSNPTLEIDNVSFIKYSKIHEAYSIIREIKSYLIKLSYESTGINIPLHTISLFENEETFTAPAMEKPKIILHKDFKKNGYLPGDILQIKGSVQGNYNSISVTQNTSPISFSLNDDEFYFNVKLIEGLNSIHITASGNRGKTLLNKEFMAVKEKQSTLEIVLDWEDRSADIDLYVKEPSGWVYFLNKENVGRLRDDVQSGSEGGEYYILEKIIPGSYEIYVHAYEINQPITGKVNILLDKTLISSKTFRLNKSNNENCFPGCSGDDWQLIEILDL